MKNPHDYEARAALMWGASMAHNNLTGCGRLKGSGIHLIEEEMHSANAGIVHGAGLSVIFPAWARQVYTRKLARFVQFANRVWNIEINCEHPEETAVQGIERMEALIRELKLPETMEDIGVSEASFPMIADQCCQNGRTVSNLCILTRKDVCTILERCCKKKKDL